jgi:hypothetical protein
MMRILALCSLMLFLFSKFPFSQQKELPNERGFYIRTNPLSVLEIDAGVMVGVRYQWNKKFSATLDPTFIFFSPYYSADSYNSQPLGIKVRADVRYHFNKRRSNGSRPFIAPEFHYKYRTVDRTTTFGINCINENCAYYMEDTYREIKTEVGGSVKMGVDVPVDKRERLSLELYGGLGLKIFKYTEESIPPGGSFISEPSHQDFFGNSEGTATPLVFGFFKMSYRLF